MSRFSPHASEIVVSKRRVLNAVYIYTIVLAAWHTDAAQTVLLEEQPASQLGGSPHANPCNSLAVHAGHTNGAHKKDIYT